MEVAPSFAEIVREYRVVFFDAYGVLKNSRGMIDGVSQVLLDLKAGGAHSYVITNDASRSPVQMAAAYAHPDFGELVAAENIISSGMLATHFMRAKVPSGSVAYIGKAQSAYYIEEANLTPLPISEVQPTDQVSALVLLDDEGFDWFMDINKAVNFLRHVNVPVLVANTDLAYPVNSNEVSIAVGSLADMIERIIGKTFIRFGKPDTQMFEFAYDRVRADLADVDRHEILMVGDTLHTDILGANKFGLDTMLVLSGNTQPEHADLHIRASGIIPTYVCESITT